MCVGLQGRCGESFQSSISLPLYLHLPLPHIPTQTHQTGYDFQYFLGTLTPVLDSLHGLAYYHVYTMALQFLQPCAFTTAQDRCVSSRKLGRCGMYMPLHASSFFLVRFNDHVHSDSIDRLSACSAAHLHTPIAFFYPDRKLRLPDFHTHIYSSIAQPDRDHEPDATGDHALPQGGGGAHALTTWTKETGQGKGRTLSKTERKGKGGIIF